MSEPSSAGEPIQTEGRLPAFSPMAVLWFALMVVALCLFGWRSLVEAPRGAAGTGWSAAQGIITLKTLIPEGTPHPVGSAENAKVRDRIVAALREAGYVPEVRASFRCETDGNCARIENIIASRRSQSGRGVLVTAHYDSVEAGPGAADDMTGAAILIGLARRLAARAPARNEVIFLFSDGEENGLHGAEAFAADTPEMRRIGAVVNVEARGVSGPSLMFETGPGNAHLIDLYARHVARPVSNSLIYEVYKAMPNDTDFSVYRKRSIGGFNFAFIGGGALYHSARDVPANVDPDTFQHHGDGVFAVVQALAGADLAALRTGADASYFDLFSWHLFVWPSGWDPAIAIAALVLVLFPALRERRGLRGKGWALLALTAMPALLYAIGWLVSYPLGIWSGAQDIDHAAPWPGRIALASAAVLAPLLLAIALRRRADGRTLLWLAWLAVSMLGVVAALKVPGAAYALTWPSLIFGLLASALRRRPKGLALAAAVGFALAALLWFAHFMVLETVFPFARSGLRMVSLTTVAWALLPLFALALSAPERKSRPVLWIAVALCLTAAAMAWRMPAYTPERPRGTNITYLDDRGARPYWRIQSEGPDDETFMRAVGMPPATKSYRALGVYPDSARLKPAERLPIAVPVFVKTAETSHGTDRIVSGDIRGTPDGRVLWLAVPEKSKVIALRVGGHQVWSPKPGADREPRSVRIAGIGDQPLRIELTISGKAPAAVFLSERSPLPDSAEARALLAARPKDAAPVHGGDAAMVSVPLRL